MQEKELEIAGGSLYYEVKKEYVVITRLQGLVSEVRVPERIEGLAVSEIAKKAFLSKKNLRRVFLPDTVTEVGDWCFAYCNCLEEVCIPNHAVSFGKAVFLDCAKLRRVTIEQKAEWVSYLLAAAVTSMQAYYLLDVEEAGGEEWLEKWDARMMEMLARPDEEGFSKQVLCGEEDYGSTDMNVFMREKRKAKVRLLLLRCLYPVGLSEERREVLEAYLQEHTKGCLSDETWQVILQEHGNDREYYQLFAELSCLNEDNFEGIIGDIGEEYPEMKAYFMRYKDESIGYSDFFDDLEL